VENPYRNHERTRQGLDHQRIRDVAALDPDPHSARIHEGTSSGRSQGNPALIGRSLLPSRIIQEGRAHAVVDCDVIQADGGTRTASITGAYVAVGLAMQKLVESGTLKATPLRDFVAATKRGHC